jgi:hypothetical protein
LRTAGSGKFGYPWARKHAAAFTSRRSNCCNIADDGQKPGIKCEHALLADAYRGVLVSTPETMIPGPSFSTGPPELGLFPGRER